MNCILKILAGIAGGITAVWARTKRPHRLALEEMGVRIVALTDYLASDATEDHDRVYAALMVLKEVSPERLRRVRKHIRVIFLGPVAGPPCYLEVGRVCYINLASIGPQQPERAITTAGVLVYLATLSELKARIVPCGGRKLPRIQSLAQRAQERALRKLSEKFCEP